MSDKRKIEIFNYKVKLTVKVRRQIEQKLYMQEFILSMYKNGRENAKNIAIKQLFWFK